MKIDMHTHVFRESAAAMVVEQMSTRMGIAAVGSGVIEDLKARLASAGLDSAVLLYAPPKPSMMHLANQFALEQQRLHPDLIVFGSVHPLAPNWEEELALLRASGMRGLKLHPEYQDYSLEDPAVLPFLEAAAPDFVLLCHMGGLVPGVTSESVGASPRTLARLLEQVPGMRFVAAHFGGQYLWEEALEHLAGKDVWLDTAASLHLMPPAVLGGFFRRHDPERLIFGSDYPFFDPGAEILALQSRLPAAFVDKILTNAAALLGLPR